MVTVAGLTLAATFTTSKRSCDADTGEPGVPTRAPDHRECSSDDAKAKAQQAAGQAQEKAQAAAGQAQAKVRDQLDQRSSQLGEQAYQQASDLRSVSEALRNQGKDRPAKRWID